MQNHHQEDEVKVENSLKTKIAQDFETLGLEDEFFFWDGLVSGPNC